MQSWRRPEIPVLPGRGTVPVLFDTVTGSLRPAEPRDGIAGLYVCGITPYDAAHLGHAATYLAFDTLVRLWLDAGFEVRYTQNVTDVDDPLLERAQATGVDWRDLAAEQTELFRQDMQALGVIPPDHLVAVTEVIDPIAAAVAELVETGLGYRVDDDVYFHNAAAEGTSPWHLGEESGLDRDTMLKLFAERGGDPDRAGKRDALDPLLWRAERDGEPGWASPMGTGRPGWHIECSVIAQETLDIPITVNGGGSDLVFPHHEFSAAHTAALTGTPLASLYSHAGMVAYDGEKMSKSLGNLVFVSKLRASGTDPRAIRLALLTEHYRNDWEWSDESLTAAEARLVRWVAWAAGEQGDDDSLVSELRTLLAHDLDTPAAVAEVDQHVARQRRPSPAALDAIDALLGIRLR